MRFNTTNILNKKKSSTKKIALTVFLKVCYISDSGKCMEKASQHFWSTDKKLKSFLYISGMKSFGWMNSRRKRVRSEKGRNQGQSLKELQHLIVGEWKISSKMGLQEVVRGVGEKSGACGIPETQRRKGFKKVSVDNALEFSCKVK